MVETFDYSSYAARCAGRGKLYQAGNGWWAYAVSAVDFWNGWVPVQELFLRLQTGDYRPAISADDVAEGMAHAFFAAAFAGWEGDVRRNSGVWVALVNGKLPAHRDDLCFGWKQDNNGDTFFGSRRYLALLLEADTEAPILGADSFDWGV